MFCTRIWGCEDFTTVVNGDRLFCAEKLPGAFEWCWLDGDDGRESQAEQPVCANGSCEGLEAAPLVRRGSRRDFSKKIVLRDRCHARCAHFPRRKCKNPRRLGGGFWLREPDDYLLSHGNPHYHRRRVVSRSCSGWEGVGPTRYGHQAKRVVAMLRSATNREEAVILVGL